MPLTYADPTTAPPPLGSLWPGQQGVVLRRAVRRAAAIPLATGLGVQWLFLVAYALPETIGVPAASWWRHQLEPLAFVSGHRLSSAALLLSAGFVFALARSGQRHRQRLLVLPAALGALSAVWVVARIGLSEAEPVAVVALVLLLVWAAAAVYAGGFAGLVDLGPAPTVERFSGVPLLVGWIVLLPGPLALGRLLLAPDLRAEAATLATDPHGLRLAALLTGASLRLYLFGAVLGVVGWLLWQCWPRRSAHRSWGWRVALVAASLVLAQLWWTAQTSAARRVTELELGTPVPELRSDCAAWVQPSAPGTSARTPTLTVSIGGRSCTTVTTFVGYHQADSLTAGTRLSPVALRTPDTDATANPTAKPLAAARYGKILVFASTTRADHLADGLVGIPARGRAPRWRFSCPDGVDLAASFPGGQNDAGSLNQLDGEIDPVVLVRCGEDRRLRLDPETGLPR